MVYKIYEIQGNTVAATQESLPNRELRKKEKEKEKQEKQRQLEKKKVFIIRQRKFAAIRTSIITLIFCGFLLGYIDLNNEITTHINNIASLKTQISETKADISATQGQIAMKTNLFDVKNIAIFEFGMHYPTKEQVVYYNIKESDFFNYY
jgi:hypothetical protein